MVNVERVKLDIFREVFVKLKNGKKILFVKPGLSDREIEEIIKTYK